MELWIGIHRHRHGEDYYPIFRNSKDDPHPTHEEIISKIEENGCTFEPDREESIEIAGGWTVPGTGMLAKGEKPAAPPPKVLIYMEGGLIQDISASQEVEVVILDGDTEGMDEEDIKTFETFYEQGEQRLYINDHGIIEATPEYVEHYFSEARK